MTRIHVGVPFKKHHKMPVNKLRNYSDSSTFVFARRAYNDEHSHQQNNESDARGKGS